MSWLSSRMLRGNSSCRPTVEPLEQRQMLASFEVVGPSGLAFKLTGTATHVRTFNTLASTYVFDYAPFQNVPTTPSGEFRTLPGQVLFNGYARGDTDQTKTDRIQYGSVANVSSPSHGTAMKLRVVADQPGEKVGDAVSATFRADASASSSDPGGASRATYRYKASVTPLNASATQLLDGSFTLFGNGGQSTAHHAGSPEFNVDVKIGDTLTVNLLSDTTYSWGRGVFNPPPFNSWSVGSARQSLALYYELKSDSDDQISEAFDLGNTNTPHLVQGGMIDNPSDVDLYKLTIQPGQRVSFDVNSTSTPLDTHLRLFGSTGKPLPGASFVDDAPGPEQAEVDSYYRERCLFDVICSYAA